MNKIEFFKHNIGNEEKASVSSCLDSLFLTTGSKTKEFETDLATYTRTSHALGTTSCTHALELALKCLGIGPGDVVVTTPLTFAATSLAVLHVGAHLIWVDVDPNTGNMDPSFTESQIKAFAHAVNAYLPVHLYGQPVDMKGFSELSRKHPSGAYSSAVIIEDAAHALEYPEVGKYSDAACFSFYPTKSITCGEGGAVVTNNSELFEKMRVNRTHGMSVDAADRYTKRFRHWDLVDIGMKCNMSDIQASMLIPQLTKVDAYRSLRKELYERYYSAFLGNKNIKLHTVDWDKHSFHLFTIQVDPNSRDAVLEELQNRNIGVAVNYRSLNTLKAFDFMNCPRGTFPNAERIGESTISLPLYPRLMKKEQDYVIKTVLEILE